MSSFLRESRVPHPSGWVHSHCLDTFTTNPTSFPHTFTAKPVVDTFPRLLVEDIMSKLWEHYDYIRYDIDLCVADAVVFQRDNLLARAAHRTTAKLSAFYRKSPQNHRKFTVFFRGYKPNKPLGDNRISQKKRAKISCYGRVRHFIRAKTKRRTIKRFCVTNHY
jgi:hypothetical protein